MSWFFLAAGVGFLVLGVIELHEVRVIRYEVWCLRREVVRIQDALDQMGKDKVVPFRGR